MKYADLYKTLKEFIDNAGIITVKTLISSLQMCDDVTEVRVKTTGIDNTKIDNLEKYDYKYLTQLMIFHNSSKWAILSKA